MPKKKSEPIFLAETVEVNGENEIRHYPANRKARRWMKKKHGVMQKPVIEPRKNG